MNTMNSITVAQNPATVIRALSRLDEDAQAAIASGLTRIKAGWLRDALVDAIRQQQEEQADEDHWLEREEERDRYLRGWY